MIDLAVLSERVSVASMLTAVIGGLGVGYLLLYRLHQRDRRLAWRYAALVGVVIALLGGVYYLGQTIEAYASGDPRWYRVASSYLVWLAYSFACGVGLGLAVRRRSGPP